MMLKVAAAGSFPVYETDVLVIGGGLAGLRAALTARQAGSRVLVVVKRKLGRSGSSAITSGGYAAAWSELDLLDDSEKHYRDTIIGGGWVNDRSLVRALVEDAPPRLQDLWDLGAEFMKTNGNYYLSPSGDHRRPRVAVPVNMRGTDMTIPLRSAVLDAGVDVLEDTLVVQLLRDGDRVVGAVGVNRLDVGGCLIQAGATILAAGGAGQMFPVTSNPVDVRGGGYGLAVRAGVPLRDMEFIQFYPWRLIRPFRNTRMPIQPSTFVHGGKLYNRRDERFMQAYDPDKREAATRDVSARGIYDQIRQGLDIDGGVLLDVSDVPDEKFRKDNGKVVQALERRGVDYREIPLIIAPEAHYFMGGVDIDEVGRTPIAGLYACGENAGGTHGGNRLNSNSIPDTQVFAHLAALAAAGEGDSPSSSSIDDGIVRQWAGRLGEVHKVTPRASERMQEIIEWQQQEVSLGLGIVRSEEGLHGLVDRIEEIRARVRAASWTTLGDFIASLEVENMCEVGEACARSALRREESRAAHYREDFPETDSEWVRTVLYREGQVMTRDVERGEEENDWELLRYEEASPDEWVE